MESHVAREAGTVRRAPETVKEGSGAWKLLAGWLPVVIGVGIAMWVWHKARFEQQADGVMSAQYAAQLRLVSAADVASGHIGQVWFARTESGGYQYRAVFESGSKRHVIHGAARVDLIGLCSMAPSGACRLLRVRNGSQGK